MRTKQTAWSKLIKYINSMPIGTKISRAELCYVLDKPTNCQNTTDGYRKILSMVNILETVSRGKYEIINHVDENLSYRQIRNVAYSSDFKSWFIRVAK